MSRNPLGLIDNPRSSGFVIVIDVDNVRAREAYKKGLRDLDLAMPELIGYAEKQDAAQLAVIEAHRAEYKAAEAEKNKKFQAYLDYKEALGRYEQEYREWLAAGHDSFWGSSKVPKPVKPAEVSLPSLSSSSFYTYERSLISLPAEYETAVWRYKQVRVALKEKLDLANAALGPFRMTEHDVRSMVSWEDGSEVAKILARAKDHDEALDKHLNKGE